MCIEEIRKKFMIRNIMNITGSNSKQKKEEVVVRHYCMGKQASEHSNKEA